MSSLRSLLLSLALLTSLRAAEVRVLPPGELPHDARLAPLKELDGYFPFTPAASPAAWAARRDRVRLQILVAEGLWPEPTKTPLHAEIYGRLDQGDYTVEKVHFESMPGFFVTGNLYRPKGGGGKHPGILCPYGHWPDGRFMNATDAEVKKQLATGAEKFEEAAHSPLQARCVHLARMGCVVFHYDMIGKSDSLQISEEIAHGFKKQRPEMNSPTRWGLFSPQAELHCQSIMGLQTWSSFRALDFLTTLPEVDPARLAVTGASGGGTQSMILAGIAGDRLAAAFPAVMVSTAMQGGCTCENASGLRVGTGNVEFAALFAPKPMGMTAAKDWTEQMPVKGFPDLQKHWAMLGAPENVMLAAHPEFPHNYNAVSRAAMYGWFNRHLSLDLPPERLEERPFPLLTREQMSVWDESHPAPAGGPDFERNLLQWWHEDAQKQLASQPETRAAALPILAGRTWAEAGEIASDHKEKSDRGDYWRFTSLIRNQTYGEEIPVLHLHPKKWNGATVLWLDDAGKSALLQPDGEPHPEVLALVSSGISVIGADLLYQGEFLAPGEMLTSARRSKNPREAPAYTFGYNESLLAQRANDILTIRKLVASDDQHPTRKFGILAAGSTGPIAALARAVAPAQFDAATLGADDFRFAQIADVFDPMFLPGGAKYGDLPGMLAAGGASPVAPLRSPTEAAAWLTTALK